MSVSAVEPLTDIADPIVDEVRRIRDDHAASFAYDLDAIYADLIRLQAAAGQPRISFGPNRVQPTVVVRPQ